MRDADVLLIESGRRILREQRMNTRKRDLDYSEFVLIAELIDLIGFYEEVGDENNLLSTLNKLLYSTTNSNIKFREESYTVKLSDESTAEDIVDAIDPFTPITGPIGPKGPKGDPGKDGKDGLKGDRGLQGERGLQGLKGDPGAKGEPGKPGVNGAPGVNGLPGAKGERGDRGLQGEKGDTGADSTVQGPKGDPGPEGPMGPMGPAGMNGQDGVSLPGPKGDKGDRGYNGNNGATPEIGTNENWWINGIDTEKPSRGPQGIQGIQGLVGPGGGDKGDDGYTPEIGVNNNWWINGVDTGKPSRGEDGTDGTDGTDGVDGVDGVDGSNGHTPVIGENENWWINGVDQNKPARGPKGEPGLNGGLDGKSPYVGPGPNYYWMVFNDDPLVQDYYETNIVAIGRDGVKGDAGMPPYIDPTTKNWWAYNNATGYYDTLVLARAVSGKSPYILDGYWMVYDDNDKVYRNSGVKAAGTDGDAGRNAYSPRITSGYTWEIWRDDLQSWWDTGISVGGQNGHTPTIGPSPFYFWTINGVVSDVSAKGQNGSNGKDAHSPIIGGNDNWFYWVDNLNMYEDSGIPAQGPQGAVGATGPDGPRGLSGGGTNLLNNSDFSDIYNPSENRPRGYAGYAAQTTQLSYVASSTGGAINNGPYCGVKLMATTTSSTAFGIVANADIINGGVSEKGGVIPGWLPNTTYVVSYYVKKVNGSAWTGGTVIRWNDLPVSQIPLEVPNLTTQWQRHAYRITTGATVEGAGRVHITESIQQGGYAGDELHFSNIQVTAGESLVPWSPRAKDGTDGPAGQPGTPGVDASLVFGSVYIAATDWNGAKECTKTAPGITPGCNVILSPPSNTNMYYACSDAILHCYATGNGTLSFRTRGPMTIDVYMNYTIVD